MRFVNCSCDTGLSGVSLLHPYKLGHLVFPAARQPHQLPTCSEVKRLPKKQRGRLGVYLLICAYMLLWKSCVFGDRGGCWPVEKRWFSHRADWLPGSPAEQQTPHPLLLTPAEADARFNTVSMKQTQTPTVPLYVACSGCARRLVENPCLYRNHNTVDLQRDVPAHARITQNITDHLLNTEIEPRSNVKLRGYGGLAQPGKFLFILSY